MTPPVATAQDTVDYLVQRSKRKDSVQLRRGFIQVGRGPGSKPGRLHEFVTARDERALDLYLLVRLLAVGHPYQVEQPSGVWARAMDLGTEGSAARVSRVWPRLERMKLIERVGRRGRDTLVQVLHEVDPSEPYAPPAGTGDPYFSLPLAYFKEGWCLRLNLAEKAILLVALYNPPIFELPLEYVDERYGISGHSG